MEQVLPIIIALLFFGYKQYKKSIDANKENKEQTATIDNADNEGENSLEGFIGSFMGLNDEVIKKDIERYQERQYHTAEIDEIEIKEAIEEPFKTETLKSKTFSKKGLNKEEIIKEHDSTEVVDFDLRQAVIYDAIFNAPYINK